MSIQTSLLSDGDVVQKKRSTCPPWMIIALLLVSIIASASISFIFTRQHYNPDHYYDPEKAYVPPASYEAKVIFRAPFFDPDFKEPIVIHSSKKHNASRFSYYNGANVYINNGNAKTTSYLLTPAYNTITCFETPNDAATELPLVFPDMSKKDTKWELDSKRVTINDVECNVWKYSVKGLKPDVDFDTGVPDEDGFWGDYEFYINARTGVPVAFHTLGHNVFNGGSHMEEYWLDYEYVVEVDDIAVDLFDAPSGMPCQPNEEAVSYYKQMKSPIDMLFSSFPGQSTENTDIEFEQWAKNNNKLYSTPTELSLRARNFQLNALYINNHNNKADKGYTLAMNHFADMHPYELGLVGSSRRSFAKKSLTGANTLQDIPDACTQFEATGAEIPAAIDWTQDAKLKAYFNVYEGKQNRRRSQVSCGSCWASAASGAINASYYLLHDFPEKYEDAKYSSVQHMLDCTWSYGNAACNGGIDSQGVSWMINENKGLIADDVSYGTFRNANGFCHYAVNDKNIKNINPWTKENVTPFTTIKGCQHVGNQWNTKEPQDQDKLIADLKEILATKGPVSISIAVPLDLYFYKGGVYDNAKDCKNGVDDLQHSVLAVGYGTDEKTGKDYITFVNTWSTMWGENGHARILAKGNVCGIATTPLHVEVE